MKIEKILCLAFVTLISVSCAVTRQRGIGSAVPQNEGCYIEISKQDMTLTLRSYAGEELEQFGIACGLAYGNKVREGDMKTPEGVFTVSEVCDASLWTHDFGDGRGEIKGAYGSHFIRLVTPPHTGIGIHGTHAPRSIGTRASEGCIRLKNRSLRKLIPYIYVGMSVEITPSTLDIEATARQQAQ